MAYANDTEAPMSLMFEFTFICHMWLSVSQHAFNLYYYMWKATYSVVGLEYILFIKIIIQFTGCFLIAVSVLSISFIYH